MRSMRSCRLSFVWLVHDGMVVDPLRGRFIWEQLNRAYRPWRYRDMERLAAFQNRVFGCTPCSRACRSSTSRATCRATPPCSATPSTPPRQAFGSAHGSCSSSWPIIEQRLKQGTWPSARPPSIADLHAPHRGSGLQLDRGAAVSGLGKTCAGVMVGAAMSDLSGQVAIVTAAPRASAPPRVALLAEAGATVVAADIQPAAKDAPGRFLQARRGLGGRRGRRCSPTSWSARAGSTSWSTTPHFGGWSTVETTTVEQWRRTEAVNSEGVFLGCKYAIEGMKKTGPASPPPRARSSMSRRWPAWSARPAPPPTSASKGAVRLLSKSVALYCAEQKYGIRCNSVHPGGVDTAIFNPLWQAMGHDRARH